MVSNLLQSEKPGPAAWSQVRLLSVLDVLTYSTVLAQRLPPLLTPLGTFWMLGELRTGVGPVR